MRRSLLVYSALETNGPCHSSDLAQVVKQVQEDWEKNKKKVVFKNNGPCHSSDLAQVVKQVQQNRNQRTVSLF